MNKLRLSEGRTTERIPIVHLITELFVGGAQSALLRLLERLNRERFAPHVACFYNGDQLVAQRLRAIGVPVTDLGMRRKHHCSGLLRLHRLLCRERPLILHTWMFHGNLPGRLIGRWNRVPVVITSRRNVNIGGFWRETLNRWTTRFDDVSIAVCEAARRLEIERAGVPAERAVTIYNGLDAEPFANIPRSKAIEIRQSLGLPNGGIVIGSVGRLHPQKRFEDLLQAMAHLRTRGNPTRLLVIGEGELRSALDSQVRTEHLEGTVVFAGLRTDIPEILSAVDVFVLPSLWEGLPNAILEAMAAGLPVVATAVGGTPEVVVDGETGILVPPGKPDALANAIERLLDDPSLRAMMGHAGRNRVCRCFTIEQTVAQTQELYERLLAERVR